MRSKDEVIYSINIEDIQDVAEQELSRELTDEELKIIEGKLGEYIDWYSAVASAMDDAFGYTVQ